MSENGTSGLDRDIYHELLSNARRRSVIKYLDQHGSLDKGELATLVAADEVEKDPDDLTSNERKRVVISLSQQHLDTLEENQVIERERDIVKQGTNFQELASGLDPNQEAVNITLENADIVIEGATVYIRGERTD